MPKDIRSEVYNALADIMYKTGATRPDMEQAIEWFSLRFWDDEWEDEYMEGEEH